MQLMTHAQREACGLAQAWCTLTYANAPVCPPTYKLNAHAIIYFAENL